MRLRIVMFLVIAPLFAMLGYLTSVDMAAKRHTANVAGKASLTVQEGATVGALVHELQKERGYSAGFIASRGVNFPNELAQQRRASDGAISAFWSDLAILRDERAAEVSDARERLDQLEAFRQDVDDFALTVPEMAAFYTSTINLLIEISRPVGSSQARDEIFAILRARALLGSAKESAGLERAMGATGLGGGFADPVYNRYMRLNGAQNALLTETAGALHDPDWLSDVQQSDAFKAIESARAQINAGRQDGDFSGLTASAWFAVSTAWIDFLRAKELELVDAVTRKSEAVRTDAETEFRDFAIFGTVLCLFVLSFAILAFERMIHRVNGLTASIRKFTKGDFSEYIDGIDGKDELGRMAAAIYHFKQDTLEMRQNAETLKADQERIKSEQDEVVTALREGLNRLSDGDLTQRLDDAFPQEYESLRQDFNTTVSRLHHALSDVSAATESIRSGSGMLEASSTRLSHKAEEQAQNVRLTAGTVQEVTSSVRAASQGAGKVRQTTQAAKTAALESDPVVREAIDAMEEISGSSHQIAQIIGLIEDIAFQTNLLALNAGVEAARAGDAGRGFAVVASEVRALAQRSSQAAMEIKSLIGQSSVNVNNGVGLVNEAGTALKSILAQVSQIDDLVSDMAKSAVEQATELETINASVTRVDSVTQETATMALEARSTCENLNRYAGHLEDLVGRFKLSRTSHAGQDAQTAAA